jgi:cephalosporin hydroxylase
VRTLSGAGDDPTVAAQVVELVAGRSALVVIGLGAHTRVLGAFDQYAGLVPPGGHAIIENTVVNGRPVASSFGPGPHEAVVGILQRHPEFVSDPTMERYTLTFNRGGYLKRMGGR